MIELVLEGRTSPVGSLTVSRLLPAARRRAVGPFVFLDHMGPVTLAAGQGYDVPPHPHVGLSTVTYFYAGTNVHRDSMGHVQINRPGELNLMTAGRGVAHSERADPEWLARGGLLHGLQIWLALPAANEEDAPSFENHPVTTLPEVSPSAGARGRVLLGSAFGGTSPVKHASLPTLVELTLELGARVEAPTLPECAVAIVAGRVDVDGTELTPDRLAVLSGPSSLRAVEASRVVFLGGPPLAEPRFMDWNFVSSRRERLAQAVDDWKQRRFPRIPGDDVDFVPYPEHHHR